MPDVLPDIAGTLQALDATFAPLTEPAGPPAPWEGAQGPPMSEGPAARGTYELPLGTPAAHYLPYYREPEKPQPPPPWAPVTQRSVGRDAKLDGRTDRYLRVYANHVMDRLRAPPDDEVSAAFTRSLGRAPTAEEQRAAKDYLRIYGAAHRLVRAAGSSGSHVADITNQLARDFPLRERGELLAVVDDMVQSMAPYQRRHLGEKIAASLVSGVWTAIENIGDTLGVRGLADTDRSFVQALRGIIANDPGRLGAPIAERVGLGALEMGAQQATGLGLAAATGPAAPATINAYWYAQMYPDAYQRMVDAGVPAGRAKWMAGVSAGLQAAIEQFEHNPLRIRTAKGRIGEAVMNYAKQGLKETSEEGMQKIVDDVTFDAARGAKPDVRKALLDARQEMADAGPAIFAMMAPGGARAVSETYQVGRERQARLEELRGIRAERAAPAEGVLPPALPPHDQAGELAPPPPAGPKPTKEQLLDDVGGWALRNPQRAAQLAAIAAPSRNDVRGIMVGPAMNAAERAELAGRIRAVPEEAITDPVDIVSPIDRSAAQPEKVRQLRALSEANVPIVERIIQAVDERLGTKSKLSHKTAENIQSKANRPEIKGKKPWHDVEHVRDALRFKTVLTGIDQVAEIMKIVADAGVRLVKVDTAKMLRPKEWGSRFAAFDLRMPNGQLVEYYMPLKELDDAKKAGNHELFEKWRVTTDDERQARRTEYLRDLNTSYDRYEAAWTRALQRLGLDDAAARAEWSRVEVSLGSVTRSKLSLRSSAEGTEGRQTPSAPRTMPTSSASTMTRPSSGSRETIGFSDSDIAASTEIIPETAQPGSEIPATTPDLRASDMTPAQREAWLAGQIADALGVDLGTPPKTAKPKEAKAAAPQQQRVAGLAAGERFEQGGQTWEVGEIRWNDDPRLRTVKFSSGDVVRVVPAGQFEKLVGRTPAAAQAPGPAGPETASKRQAVQTRMAGELDDLKKYLQGRAFSGLDPELVRLTAKVIVSYTELGVLKFADAVQRLAEDLPEHVEKLGGAFRAGWAALQPFDPRMDPAGDVAAILLEREIADRGVGGEATGGEREDSGPDRAETAGDDVRQPAAGRVGESATPTAAEGAAAGGAAGGAGVRAGAGREPEPGGGAAAGAGGVEAGAAGGGRPAADAGEAADRPGIAIEAAPSAGLTVDLKGGRLWRGEGENRTAVRIPYVGMGGPNVKGVAARLRRLGDLLSLVEPARAAAAAGAEEAGGGEKARQALNEAYDRVTKQWGPLHAQTNRVMLSVADDELPLLLSLEDWDAATQTARKGAPLTGKAEAPVETAAAEGVEATPAPETETSAEAGGAETPPAAPRTIAKSDVAAAFPGAHVWPTADGWRVELAGGDFFDITLTPEISIAWAQAEKQLGPIDEAERENIEAAGQFEIHTGDRVVNGLGLMRLAAGVADAATVRHEAIHVARAAGLFSNGEWAALVSRYSKPSRTVAQQEEAIAGAAEAWESAAGLGERVRAFIRELLDRFGLVAVDAKTAQVLMAQPAFWKRPARPAAGTPRYQLRRRRQVANPAVDEIARKLVRDVDQRWEDAGEPQRRADADVAAAAERRMDRDYLGERQRILRVADAGGGLTDEETLIAKAMIDQEAADAVRREDPEAVADAMALIDAYRRTGTEQARGFRQRRDPTETPPQARARVLMENLLTPPDALQERIERARQGANPAAVARLEKQWFQRVLEIKRKLRALGIDLDRLEQLTLDDITAMRVAKTISTLKASGWDKAYEYWQNAILSALTTQGANIIGNYTNAGWSLTAEWLTEALVNTVVRDPTGAQWGEFPYRLAAILPGLSRGARNFLKTWVTEQPYFEREITGQAAGVTKLDTRQPAIGGWTGAIVRSFGYRPLLAVDEFFKSVIGEIAAAEQAYRLAKAAGLRGDGLRRRMAALVAEPESEAWQKALERSQYLTFQKELGKAGKVALRARRDIPGLRYLIPFVTTPANIFKTGLRKSPLGTANLVAKAVANRSFRGLTPEIAEQVLAWAAVLALMGVLDDDDGQPRITGTRGELEYGARQTAHRTLPTQSIRLGDRWYSYARIEPVATAIGTTVDWLRALRSGDPHEMTAAPFDSLVGQVKNKTFLSGLGDILRALEGEGGEEKLVRWASGFATSWVPNIARAAGRSADETYSERGVWGEGTDWWRRLGRRTLQRTELGIVADEPAIDLWGREAPRSRSPLASGPLTDWLYQMVVPVRNQDAQLIDADRMLVNWNLQHPSERRDPVKPAKTYTVAGEKKYMTDAQYTQFQRLAGRAAALLVGFELGGEAAIRDPTAADIERMTGNISAARTIAKAALVKQWTEGATPGQTAGEMARAIHERHIISAGDALSRQRPLRGSERPAWTQRREKALEYLERAGVDRDEALRLYRRHLRKTMREPRAMLLRLSRLKRAWPKQAA